MTAPISVPTLQIQGELDPCVLTETAAGSGEHVTADYEWKLMPGVGHFPHQERPDDVTNAIVQWCAQ
jgi:pimeloyl-ACP methyl ester carboxylesterase